MKVLRRVFPPPRDRKDAILWAHELTGALWITLPDGTSGKVADGGGGGTSDHAALTHLAWLSSAHTLSGTYKLAGSAASTAAAEVAYTAFTATLLDDPDAATARATLGAAYVSRSISTTLPLAGGGDLSADRTLTLSGWSGTTDGRPLYRNGTAVATATVSAPLTFTAGALAITQSDATHDGYLSSADWSVFNSKQAGSAELTGLASLGDGIPVRSTTWQTLGYSTGLSLSSTTLTLDSGLQSLTSADASAGLPYVTVANTWATATYTAMLSVVGGAWKVIGWRESGGQDLTNGAIADGQLVARVGTALAGVDVSATPAASKVVKSGAGGTIDNGWLDADIKALGDNSTNGLWARTGSGTGSARTLTAGSGVTITNGDGVSGNPTISATGSTNTDLDPTTGYMAEFWPGGGGSIRSMETVGVRGGSATGNTSTQKRTKFTGGAVAADFYSTVTIRADQNPVIKMRFWTGPSLAATLRHKHGLTTYTGWTTTDTEAASSKFVMLRYSTGKGDTTWKLVTNDGTTETVTDTTVTPATNTEYTVTITYSGNGTLITCVVNGVSCSTSTALPAATTEFATFACGVYGTTSAREWYHVGAYVRVAYP